MSTPRKRLVELTETQIRDLLGALDGATLDLENTPGTGLERHRLERVAGTLRDALYDCPGTGRPAIRGRNGTAACPVCRQAGPAIGAADIAYYRLEHVRTVGRHDRPAPTRGDVR